MRTAEAAIDGHHLNRMQRQVEIESYSNTQVYGSKVYVFYHPDHIIDRFDLIR
ncbi:hypothetical protein GCM10010916_05950 [Paenibacillus abyssi]|uniref:Uncharacterized protein n=1 Tax=Paenibacillus abyssi TaxID=1340531 RepID=A0A917FNM0_9BACL|nr:hypothetical protein GCM10010916_05950 [Paenibacillus abyssi]